MTDPTTPTTEAGRALLAELAESPLPGARYAHQVVGLRLAAIEAQARADERRRLAGLVEAATDVVLQQADVTGTEGLVLTAAKAMRRLTRAVSDTEPAP